LDKKKKTPTSVGVKLYINAQVLQ